MDGVVVMECPTCGTTDFRPATEDRGWISYCIRCGNKHCGPMSVDALANIRDTLDRWWDDDHSGERRYGQSLMDAMSRIDTLICDMKENLA